MPLLLVSVGSDGFTDWVRLPDGQKLNLGPLSIMSFVAKLVGKGRGRQTVEAYLRDGEAMLSVDEGRMWDLLTPVRSRMASGDGSFMAPRFRTARKGNMPTIHEDLTALERHISDLNKHAGHVTPASLTKGHEILVKLADKIKSPNQSKNDTYYGLGAPNVYEVDDAAPKPHTVNASEGLAFDTLQANQTVAQDILAKATETAATIDKLAKAGKRFNAAKAKADVHAVTSKVAGILKTDLTAAWVQGDLAKLAAQTDHLHGLFHAKS